MHVSEQQRNFELSLVDRLKVDPKTASFEGWDTNGDQGWVTLKHLIPADELLQMWRDAAPPPPPKITDVKKGDTLRVHGVDSYRDIVVDALVLQPEDGSYLIVEHKGGA